MKLSILVATLSLPVCMTAQSTASKVVHSSGAYVYMSSPAGNGTQMWLYALHTEQGKTPATFLEFDIFTRNPDGSSTDTFESGDVPDGALTGNTTKQLNLSVDTSPDKLFRNDDLQIGWNLRTRAIWISPNAVPGRRRLH